MITQNLPAYLYQQYSYDSTTDDLQAFFTAYNNSSQTNLDTLNNLNLPIYTNPNVIGILLDWIAQGIYGQLRPSIGTPSKFSPLNVYDTVPYNTIAYSQDTELYSNSYYVVNDDIFKRILTWNFYKGDGFQFNCQWLKRRIKRFLFGYNGVNFPIDNTFDISIIYNGNQFNITLPNTSVSDILKSCFASGVLNLPFQYTYVLSISSGVLPWKNNSNTVIGWKNNSSSTVTWFAST
jgi:hypothetical protein